MTITASICTATSCDDASICWRPSFRFSGSTDAELEAARLRELRPMCRVDRGRPPSCGGWACPDRSDHRRDEPAKTQARPNQNPQRPYARHPGHRLMRWSPLHGDMQGMASKEVPFHSEVSE